MSDTYDFSTPMMQQYLKLKAEYADCILLFRLGDFYEMFLDDAKIGADVLEITLTSRSRSKDGRIPMAGVPYHAVDSYISKLIKAGYKVAICDQISEPGKGLVEREVTRIITPGTVLDQQSLNSRAHNYLLLLHQSKNQLYAAAADLGTGDVRAQVFDEKVTFQETLQRIMATLQPSEVLLSETLFTHAPARRYFDQQLTVVYPLTTGLKDTINSLETAVAALTAYLAETQKQPVTHLTEPQLILTPRYLQLDPATIANLELVEPNNFRNDKHTLLAILDQTETAMGGRLLRQWILQPLGIQSEIESRLTIVDWLLHHQPAKEKLLHQLEQMADSERLFARLSVGLGTPRDLRHLVNSLKIGVVINDLIAHTNCPALTQVFKIDDHSLRSLLPILDQLLVDDPPIDSRQGGLIAEGQHPELDRLRSLIRVSREKLMSLEQAERSATGISTLKVRFNKVFGFYIEVSNSHLAKVPDHYLRKQTLVNGERFITPELKDYEEQILTAEEKSHQLEYELYLQAVGKIKEVTTEIQTYARAIAQLDCLISFAQVSAQYRYTKPTLTTSGQLKITQGRHPVVERILSKEFVPNDLTLSTTQNQLILLTGPNMAGKSVLMRQTALIVLMAHLGCFVPAKSAEISLTDRIFVRSGAQDVISAGLSTFMVEMSETAYILEHATDKSLIVMDEIGRGTSTYDGICIASAIAEYLVRETTGPKTLFATHYHELQALESRFAHKIVNMHLAVEEHNQQLVFLYALQPGPASHSFGVAVAKLAKLPKNVVQRAETLLEELERNQVSKKNQPAKTHLGAATTTSTQSKVSPLVAELKQLNLDQLTPLAALNLLAKWKAHANN